MKKKNVEQVKTEKFDWHACSVDETLKKAESSKDSLTQSEASERLAKNGANVLPRKKPKSVFLMFIPSYFKVAATALRINAFNRQPTRMEFWILS